MSNQSVISRYLGTPRLSYHDVELMDKVENGAYMSRNGEFLLVRQKEHTFRLSRGSEDLGVYGTRVEAQAMLSYLAGMDKL